MVKVSGSSPNRPMKVLSLGMAKTGTWSMADAYRAFGYKNVYHALEAVLDAEEDYIVLERANAAIFPNAKNYHGKPFTRKEWDEIFAPCEAITDIGAFYAESLIEAYPEAKVVLVTRDIEAWYPSWCTALDMACGPMAVFFSTYFQPLIGMKSSGVARDFHLGWSEATTLPEAKANAKRRFQEYNDLVRRLVPKERLLEFRLSAGWEPLCEFLGEPVPDMPFPRRNEAESFRALVPLLMKRNLSLLVTIYGPWVLAGVLLLVAVSRYT